MKIRIILLAAALIFISWMFLKKEEVSTSRETTEYVKRASAVEAISVLEMAALEYAKSRGSYPQLGSGFVDDLVRNGFLLREIIDPWGNYYVFCTNNSSVHFIVSCGPDGELSSPDDVKKEFTCKMEVIGSTAPENQ